MESNIKQELSAISDIVNNTLQNCTRVEVIDKKGRSYINWNKENEISISIQDDGKTFKIFIKDK